MLKKLAGYLFLSILSFGVFTAFFHAAAHAEGSAALLGPLLVKRPIAKVVPPPTQLIAYEPSPTVTPTPTEAPTPTPTDTPTPTPTETITPSPTDTPTPTPNDSPTPTPAAVPVTDLESVFTKYSGQYSVSKDLLEKIAQCESGKRADAAYLSYLGMFQFGPDTWRSVRTEMNLDPNPDLRTNAEEAIKTAAYMISKGRQGAWPNCSQ